MSKSIKRRRGTAVEHQTFVGLDGEITVDTTSNSIRVHDNSTAGGFETARADGSNIHADTIDINGGTIDGAVIGANVPAAITGTDLAGTSLDLSSSTVINSVLDEDNFSSNSATALATQQSIKAYVDSQVGTVDTLAEILANGNTTGANDIDVDAAQKVQFRDAAIYINSSADGQLDIVADTEIQIAATTVDINGAVDVSGTLGVTGVATLASLVATTADINAGTIDGTVIGGTTAAAGSFTNITVSGTVDGRDVATDGTKLDGIEALADVTDTTNVTAAGALMDSELTNITAVKALDQGVATTDSPSFAGLTATTADINGGTIDGTVIGGTTAAAGSFTTGAFSGEIAANGGIALGDNDKATFGASDDLEIYHDGSNSYIKNSGTGNLYIQDTDYNGDVYIQAQPNENSIIAYNNSSVVLFFDNAQKIMTTATGIDVTGTATADGLTVVGITSSSNGTYGTKLTYSNGNQSGVIDTFGNHNLEFRTNDERAMNIASNGDISFYEDTGTSPKFVWDSSAEKLTLSGTGGLDVTGTVTADGLTVGGSGVQANLLSTNASEHYIYMKNTEGSAYIGQDAGVLQFWSGGNTGGVGAEVALKIDGNNDISFFEDTGTTAKFFWDSSAEYLSVGSTTGTFAPINYIGSNGRLGINNGNTAGGTKIQSFAATNANGYLAFEGWDKEYMRIDSSGNVGIGTTVPGGSASARQITSVGSASSQLTLTGGGSFSTNVGTNGTVGYLEVTGANNLTLYTNSVERMRIDASGNVGIGTTSPNAKLDVNSGGSGNTASFKSGAANVNEYAGITIHTQTISNDDWYGSEIRSINTGGTPNVLNPRLGFFTQDIGTYLPANRTEKMSILGNGNVGIGTSSPSYKLSLADTTQAGTTIQLYRTGSAAGSMFINGGLAFGADGGNGDTQRMVISSSTGNVGINANSPTYRLTVQDAIDTYAFNIRDTIGNERILIGSRSTAPIDNITPVQIANDNAGNLLLSSRTNIASGIKFYSSAGTTAIERMVIDSSGNVGIGTNSPGSKVTISDPGTGIGLINAASGNFNIGLLAGTGSPNAYIFQRANAPLLFGTNNVERARLTSDGGFLVGKTSSGIGVVGIEVNAGGQLLVTADGDNPVDFNRKTSDGVIALFRKSGTSVGSIGTYSGGLDVAGSTRGLRITDGSVFPVTNAGSVSDNYVNLGYSSGRFKDLYLSGGVYLGGTGAANHLDDYEEGTWTPTGISAGSVDIAKYTKIGDVVVISLAISGAITLTTGIIGGLPFSAVTTSCPWYFADFAVGAGEIPMPTIAGTEILLRTADQATGGISTLGDLTGSYISITATYHV